MLPAGIYAIVDGSAARPPLDLVSAFVEGDTVCVSDAADGSLRISAANREFVEQMEAVQDFVTRYRHALRELAK